jgi:hypothetical protein
MTDEPNYSLLLEFDNESNDFTLGFECGRIWAILQLREEPFDCEVHAENAEMILRMAEATNRSVQSKELGDGWLTVMFGGVE